MVMGVPVPAPTRVENPQAHDLYLQGRNLWTTRDREKTEQAIELYQQALKLDPNYALAWMGIADAYGLMAANGQMPAHLAIQDCEEAAAKAISLEPSLAEAHAPLGLLKMNQWDWRAADEEIQRSIVLNPNYDRAYVRAGLVRFYLGDFAEADRLIRRAETLRPYSLSLPIIRAELYYYARRYDDALDLSRHVQTIDPAMLRRERWRLVRCCKSAVVARHCRSFCQMGGVGVETEQIWRPICLRWAGVTKRER